mgnify:CR=1 FL=1
MQLVLLAGELGEKYGKQHEYYNLQTPADAIKLLCFNYPKLKQELIQAHHNGVGYKVIQGGASMGYDELHLPFGSKPLLVVPVITGSGGGSTSQILIGVALVAAAIVFAPAGAGFAGLGAGATAGTFTLGAGASVAIGSIGTSLILSGTASLISPQPELGNLGGDRIRGKGTSVRGSGPDGVTRGSSGQQSYAFTGPANTVGTGTTLPVIYGRVITGGHLLAANLEVSDDSDPLKLETQKPSLKTLKINSDSLERQLTSCGGLDSRRGVSPIKSSGSSKRQLISKVFGKDKDQKIEAGAEYKDKKGLKYKKEKDIRTELDVIFSVKRGLYDYVAAKGTTKIDGFITYRISVTITENGADIDVASAQVTLQGMVNESQNFTYGHRMEMPKVASRDNDRMDITVEIIDAAVHDDATFEVQGYGYRLLTG